MQPARILVALSFLIAITIAPAFAQEEEIGFDDVVEEVQEASSVPSWVDKIHFSGRFDLNLEVLNPNKGDELRTNHFRNYHNFLFLKVTPDERFTLDAEILNLSYYEFRAALPYDLQLTAGKIWVPFGATPFHHYYGAVQGDPFTGLLLPNVWSEFGMSVSKKWVNAEFLTMDTDMYVMRGFDGQTGQVLNFAAGGSDNLFAYGARLKLGWGTKIAAWGSMLYNTFDETAEDEGQLLLWGGDLLLDYGLLNVPVLKDLRFRGAFARAEVQDKVLVDPDFNKDGWYYRYGDYAEVTFRGLKYVHTRVRYGTIINFDDEVSNKDSHNWDFALMTRLGSNINLLAQYQLNMEERDEIDNDLFRAQLVFEF
jgi:hypothetical protein